MGSRSQSVGRRGGDHRAAHPEIYWGLNIVSGDNERRYDSGNSSLIGREGECHQNEIPERERYRKDRVVRSGTERIRMVFLVVGGTDEPTRRKVAPLCTTPSSDNSVPCQEARH